MSQTILASAAMNVSATPMIEARIRETRSVFDRYNIVSESDLRAGVDQLAAYVKKLATETNVEPLKKAE